jgi:putative selenium metabolism protein SsnA
MKTRIIENAVIVAEPLNGDFKTGDSVAIVGEKIAAVGPADEIRTAYADADVLDAGGCVLLPGLVDAHTHLYGALIGAKPPVSLPPQNFPEVLDRVWWQWDKALTETDIEISAQIGCASSLRCGITTIFDHHASPSTAPGSLSVLAETIEDCGLRACLAYEVSDRDGKTAFEEGVAENTRFIAEVIKRQDSLFRGLFGLHAVFSLSDQSLRRCGEELIDTGVGCHMHMAEHITEVQKFARTHSQPIPEYLRDIGLLRPNSVLAHTVHISEDDIQTMTSAGAFNVHNPMSNLSNGVGIAPVNRMIQMQQPVCLGSDGFFDLPQEAVLAKIMQITASGNPSAFSDKQALVMLYDHNIQLAENIFGCRLGKIAPQYTADLILVAYDPVAPIFPENQISHVLNALTSGTVRTVMVNGFVVMQEGELMGIDEGLLHERAQSSAQDIWSRF